MIPHTCIEIHTRKLPMLPGGNEELVNEGMYGKALCQYLEKELAKKGLEVPVYVCADRGWWIEAKDNEFFPGPKAHADSEPGEDPTRYALVSSISKARKWSRKSSAMKLCRIG